MADQLTYYKFLIKYAWRHLLRNPRRTFLTILTVALSVCIAIVATRYSTAALKLWQEGASDTGAAHAQVHRAGYFQKQEGVQRTLTLSDDIEFTQKISEDSRVVATSKRLKIEGIISAKDKSIYFLGVGVDPEAEMNVSPRLFREKKEDGEFIQASNRQGVTIGEGLAKTMDLKIGDEATLIAQTLDGSVNGLDVVVVGIVSIPLPSFSKRVVYLNLDYAQELLRMPGLYTELAIRLKDSEATKDFVADYRSMATQSGVELRGWWDVEPMIRNVEKIWNSVLGIISLLLFILAGLSVLNIIFMMVGERTVEIGTLMAIGAKSSSVATLFAIESLLIGVFGGALGFVVGNLIVVWMGFVGVPFDSPFGSGEVMIHPTFNLGISLAVSFLALMICGLAAILPAQKATRVEPVRAFRGQLT